MVIRNRGKGHSICGIRSISVSITPKLITLDQILLSLTRLSIYLNDVVEFARRGRVGANRRMKLSNHGKIVTVELLVPHGYGDVGQRYGSGSCLIFAFRQLAVCALPLSSRSARLVILLQNS